MNYTSHPNWKAPLLAAVLATFLFSGFTPARGQDLQAAGALGKTQRRASADAVPEGLNASDWSSIRAAYQAHRHQAVRAEGGSYRARNPEQQWSTEFDAHGFTTRPDVGDWEWGLELKSYGFAG
jgi:hypothetical protein